MVIKMYYLNIFFIFAFLGHILENIVYPNVDSGILYGLWTPIYGFGVILIILIDKYLKKFKLKAYLHVPLLFLISAISLGIIETIGGYYIEIVFGRIFWNYANHFVPIGKYTSLQMMSTWGICSILVIYVLIPIINKFINKIPTFLTSFMISLFFVDIIYTYYKLANIFTKFFIS